MRDNVRADEPLTEAEIAELAPQAAYHARHHPNSKTCIATDSQLLRMIREISRWRAAVRAKLEGR